MIRKDKDAFGWEIWDHWQGKKSFEIVERDDGHVAISGGAQVYFREYQEFPRRQKKGLRFARGRVVDIGCGAGRCALHLQEKGLDVLGIDNSPLAVKVCRQRGLKKCKLLSITQLSRKMGEFDTILMYGNNFGLFGSLQRARWLLRRFNGMTSDNARIIAETLDPYQTESPDHKAYQRWNRTRGRMGGQLKIRIRYRNFISDWFDYLLASREEIQEILAGTGWRVKRFIDEQSPRYVVVIEKDQEV